AWTHDYLGLTAPTGTAMRAPLQAAASGGADVIVYCGHGNAVRMGANDPRIVNVAEADSVASWTGSGVFISNCCNGNWIANNVSNYQSIAILGLSQPQGGISASLGAAAYTFPQSEGDFCQRLLAEASRPGTTWGAALLRTQQWSFQRGSDPSQ